MKKATKFIFAALVCGTITTEALAQAYVGGHVGYSFSTAPSVLGTAGTQDANGDKTSANIYSSNGAGVNVGLNVGYMLSEHFGIDIAADYLIISPQKISTTDNTSSTQKVTGSNTISGSQIRVTPSLVVAGGSGGFTPYGRFGVVLPVAGSTINEVSNVTEVPALSKTYTTKVKTETQGAFSLGFNTAIGAKLALSDKLSVFGELSLTTLSIKAASTKYTEYSSEGFAGTTKLEDLPVYQKETVYVDKLTASSNNASYNSSYKTTQANDALAPVANYNTLGINVGVKFAF